MGWVVTVFCFEPDFWAQSQAVVLASCIILGKLLNLCAYFLICKVVMIIMPTFIDLLKITRISRIYKTTKINLIMSSVAVTSWPPEGAVNLRGRWYHWQRASILGPRDPALKRSLLFPSMEQGVICNW